MTNFNDFGSDDFITEGFGNFELDTADYHPEAWAVGSDEIGNPVYCEAALSGYLQRDAI